MCTWWITHVRGRGRGLTFDDPDLSANLLIVVPSLVYIVYAHQTRDGGDEYSYNKLYQVADVMYFVGAVFYVLCALRDDGWFNCEVFAMLWDAIRGVKPEPLAAAKAEGASPAKAPAPAADPTPATDP